MTDEQGAPASADLSSTLPASRDQGGREESVDGAIARLREAVGRNPQDPELYMTLAREYERSGQLKEALATYLELVSAAPSLKTYLAIASDPPTYALPYVLQWLNAKWQLRTCTEVGRWVRVTGRPFIDNSGEFRIGNRAQILSHYARSVYAISPGGTFEVGSGTILNYGVDIAVTKHVHIGSDCLIGTHVIILDNDFHELTDRNKRPEGRPVHIGDRAWVGNGSVVLPGVRIGDDAAISAGSVVMTDVPARSLAIGNPARVIKKF